MNSTDDTAAGKPRASAEPPRSPWAAAAADAVPEAVTIEPYGIVLRPGTEDEEAQNRQAIDALDEMIDGLLDAGVSNNIIFNALIARAPIFGVDSGMKPAVIRGAMYMFADNIENYVAALADAKARGELD